MVSILLPALVLLCLSSLSTSVCLPKPGPQESLGMLIVDVSGILKRITLCRELLHTDKSVSYSIISCWKGQLSCISRMCALRTPVAHSNSNPLKLVTSSCSCGYLRLLSPQARVAVLMCLCRTTVQKQQMFWEGSNEEAAIAFPNTALATALLALPRFYRK